jgi:hypothetical protein
MYAKSIVILGSLCATIIGFAYGELQAHAAAGVELHTAFDQLTDVDADAAALELAAPTMGPATNTAPQISALALKCVQVSSSTKISCQDSGGFASTCAVAKCGAGYQLTGGGGACSAGNRKLKSAVPNFSAGSFHVMCEEQGVGPTAAAICCKLGSLASN